jgi:cytochrome b
VWDPLVRVFHWSLVGAFAVAWITGDELLDLHLLAGYLILFLVLFRLVWGVIGTRHARFSDFVRGPSTTMDYLKDVAAFRARRYLGHNPAGGAMVIALLLLLTATGISGLAVYGAEEAAGPFAGFFSGRSHYWGEILEELHEFLANLTLLLVAFHVAGVLLASLQHGENLVRSMFNGRKRVD